MNEINVRNEILDSIDNLNQVTMESTFDVFGSMINAYDKANMITEYSNAEDLSMFAIFQEAEVSEGDAKTNADAKKQSFGYRLIHFIPNLLKKLWGVIKNAWNGITAPENVKPSSGLAAILEKCKGKTAEWVKEHQTELGISGALLGIVLSILAVSNADKLKALLDQWRKGIKACWVSAKLTPYIAFEGGSFVTNIKSKGLIETMKELKQTLDAVTEITKKIAQKGGSIKEISAEMEKIIQNAKFLQADPTFLTGENIVEETDSFLDLITKVSDAFNEFANKKEFDISGAVKPMFEENGLEPSFIAQAEQKASVLTKIANGIAVFLTATSSAFIGFVKWVGECLGLVKKANAEIDGSGASVNMEDQSKEEKSEEESSEIPGKDTTPISNEEVDKAMVAAQENPSEETIVNAIEKSKVLMDDINTASDPKKMQLVHDTNASIKQAENAIKSGKVPADKGTAKRVGTFVRSVDKAAEIAKKENPSKADIDKAEGGLKKATRVISIPVVNDKVSDEDKKKGQLGTKQGERYIFKSDGELMNFLNEHLGKGNPVISANMATKTIKYLTKAGKEAKAVNHETPPLQRLKPAIGNISKGTIRYGDHTWILEFAEDELDACIMMLESAIMEYLGEDETFVVEYADGTTEEMTSFIMEAYDEVSAEEAAFEEINNHWYR